MNIISSTTVSREGSACYIEESYSMVEQFGVYAIIRFYRVSGLGNSGEVTVIMASSDQAEVRAKYKEYCKMFKI